MRKQLFAALVAAVSCFTAASAQGAFKKLAATGTQSAAVHPQAPSRAAGGTTVTLTKAVLCYYDATAFANPDYYVVLTDDADATYDVSAGKFTGKDCSFLAIDFYGYASSPITLPTGDYTSASTEVVGTYSSEFSVSATYDSNGKQQTFTAVTGTVSVTKSGDTYTITAQDKSGVSYTYTGTLTFQDANASSYVFPQITSNVQTTFTGGLAYYYGNLYESKTGNIYINLYDCDFNNETGGMNADGIDLALCAFARLFPDPDAAHVEAGTYTVAKNFNQFTYYPGLEVDYMGSTIPFGSYVKQRKDDDYAYGYITEGTFTITENSDNTYDVSVDLKTNAGLTVKGTASHITFTVLNVSDDKEETHISNLEEDVDLDLGYVTTAYAWRNSYDYDGKQTNGCNVFTLDISRPSGSDMESQPYENVCDLMRFEFITDGDADDLRMGTYTVMDYDHLYTNMYEPFHLVQGYFYNGGELTGTRYYGYYGAPYGYVKWIAPAESGTVSIENVGNDQYKFTVNLIDDAGWRIRGNWTGPISRQYSYDPTGIDKVQSGSSADAPVEIFGMDGSRIGTFSSLKAFDNADFQGGIYIVKGKNKQPYKVVRK